MGADIVWKEEYLQDGKNNEQLNQDNRPQCSPQRHLTEAVSVEVVNPINNVANIVNIFKTTNFSLVFRRKSLSLQRVFENKLSFKTMNNKKIVLPLVAVIVLLIAGVAYLAYNLNQEKQVNKDMQELAVLEKQEMENEYQQFADQYSEMKTRINNDSIINQLTREQERTKQLLEELRQTKANDAAEITRLKKELATVRAVLRSYVLQIDSLNQLNAELMDENNRVRSELEYTNQQNMALASSNMTLSEKVAIASQLNATNISLMPLNKRGKNNKTMKKARSLQVAFNIARNVTAANGTREIFIRVTNPMGEVLNGGGSFTYENRQLAYTMKRTIDYSGEETSITATWTVNETLPGGSYNVSIFADGNMIGSRNFTFEK